MARKAKPGDLFTSTLPDGAVVARRILLNVLEQCIKPKLLRTSSSLAFYADTVMQEVYRGPGPDSGVLIPGLFTWQPEDEPSGNVPVEPETVEFPQGLELVGPRPHFTWGELSLPVPMSVADMRRIGMSPPIEAGELVSQFVLYAQGRQAEMDKRYQKPDVFSMERLDFRFSPHRDEVYRLLGDRIGSRYYETALRYGYDLKRFYGAEFAERELFLCPYCHAPFDRSKPTCATCGEETGHDAPLQVTAREMGESQRKPCKACRTPIISTAIICPGCKASQRN